MWDLSSPTRDRTRVPCIGRRILYHWTTREVTQLFKYENTSVSAGDQLLFQAPQVLPPPPPIPMEALGRIQWIIIHLLWETVWYTAELRLYLAPYIIAYDLYNI